MIISPIQLLFNSKFYENQKSALDLLKRVLNTHGQFFRSIWPQVLNIIKSSLELSSNVSDRSGTLARHSFPCLQLICTDYLQFLPSSCVETSIDILGRFCLQPDDMNISLTSVGLMWNIAYFLREERTKSDRFDDYEMLFKSLLGKLSLLSADSRAELRNSIIQTMIRSTTFNGSILTASLWILSLIEIIYPIYRQLSIASAKEKAPSGIHAHDLKLWEKKWDETKCSFIGGIAKIFMDCMKKLLSLPEMVEFWNQFLEICLQIIKIESNEVSVNMLKALKSVISSKTFGSAENRSNFMATLAIWKKMVETALAEKSGVSNQEIFLQLCLCFPDIYGMNVDGNFTLNDARQSFGQFKRMVSYSFQGEIISDVDNLTPLQQSVIDNISNLRTNNTPELQCLQLEICCELSALPFRKNPMELETPNQGKRNLSQSSFVAISRKATSIIVENLKDPVICKAAIESGIFKKVIKVKYIQD